MQQSTLVITAINLINSSALPFLVVYVRITITTQSSTGTLAMLGVISLEAGISKS